MTTDEKPRNYDICGAKRRRIQAKCTRPAGWGTDHPGVGRCKLHGGSTPAGRRAATIAKVKQDLAEWGGRLDITPPQALLDLVQTKAAEVAYWDRLVAELPDGERAGLLVTQTEEGVQPLGDVNTTTRKAAQHIYVQMLHKSQDQLATYSAAAVRVGVDKALVELATIQGHAYLEFGRLVATLAGVPDSQIPNLLRAAIEQREKEPQQ